MKPHALFVTDLDGTLITDRAAEVLARDRRAIREATEAGVVVALVTGRRQSAVQRIYAQLDGLVYRVATSNGAVVLRPDNVWPERVHALDWTALAPYVLRTEFAHATILWIRAPATGPDTDDGSPDCFVLEAETRRWFCSWTPYDRESYVPGEPPLGSSRPLVHLALRVETRGEADQLAVLLKKDLCREQPVSLHVVKSPVGSGALLELVPKGGKGLAIRHFVETLGISSSATAAIGDELNDCDLLEAVEYPFAVGGSLLASLKPDAVEVSQASEGAVADAIQSFRKSLNL
jgi:hydroxymethylpyrimidine pyrophosphatase-like HAD family hydrolase